MISSFIALITMGAVATFNRDIVDQRFSSWWDQYETEAIQVCAVFATAQSAPTPAVTLSHMLYSCRDKKSLTAAATMTPAIALRVRIMPRLPACTTLYALSLRACGWLLRWPMPWQHNCLAWV